MPMAHARVSMVTLRLIADPGSEDSGTRTWSGQASEHDADHGEANEGDDGAGVSLEVTGESAVAADPGEGALDDPSLGQDDEFVQLGALDDFELPRAGIGDDLSDCGALRRRRRILLIDGKRRPASRSRRRMPSRSWMLARCTTTFSSKPRVSTRMRHEAVTFLPAS